MWIAILLKSNLKWRIKILLELLEWLNRKYLIESSVLWNWLEIVIWLGLRRLRKWELNYCLWSWKCFIKSWFLLRKKWVGLNLNNLGYWWWLILNKKIGICCFFFKWNGGGIWLKRLKWQLLNYRFVLIYWIERSGIRVELLNVVKCWDVWNHWLKS